MTITIIRMGNLPVRTTRIDCLTCRCVFMAERSDCRDDTGVHAIFKCPCCDEDIYVRLAMLNQPKHYIGGPTEKKK